MDYEEQDVDEELTSYLEKDVEKKKRTFKQAFEEKEEESEDEEQTKLCTKETREQIYALWSQACEEKGKELLPLVQKLSTMSESEAKAYLSCLKAVHSKSVHSHITSRILEFVSYTACHPHDVVTPLAMQQDEYLSSGISLLVGDFLSTIGRLGIIALLFVYAGSSRYTYGEKKKGPLTNKERGIVPTSGAPEETLSIDGMRESRNGENDTHGKVND